MKKQKESDARTQMSTIVTPTVTSNATVTKVVKRRTKKKKMMFALK